MGWWGEYLEGGGDGDHVGAAWGVLGGRAPIGAGGRPQVQGQLGDQGRWESPGFLVGSGLPESVTQALSEVFEVFFG